MPLSCPSAVSLRDSAARDSQSLQCSENRDRRTICAQRTELPETARLHSLWSTTKRQETPEKMAVRLPAATPVQSRVSLPCALAARPGPCTRAPVSRGRLPPGAHHHRAASRHWTDRSRGRMSRHTQCRVGGVGEKARDGQAHLTPTGHVRGTPQRIAACRLLLSFPVHR